MNRLITLSMLLVVAACSSAKNDDAGSDTAVSVTASSSTLAATTTEAVTTTTAAPATSTLPASTSTVAPTTAAPTTTEVPTTTEERHTGGVQSCSGGKVFVDQDGDGWGTCQSTATTTTEPAPATTVDPANQADLGVLLAGTSLTSDKDRLVDAIKETSFSVESVDLIDFKVEDGPPPTAALFIAVTSGYNGIEYRDEVAWDLFRGFAVFWDKDDGSFRNEVGTLKPGLILTVDTTTYIAPMELMAQVADLEITSTDFLNLARQ